MVLCFDTYEFGQANCFLILDFLLSLILNLIGEAKINWRVTYESNHVLYIVDLILALAGLGLAISFLCLRDQYNIYSTSNSFCIYITYVLFVFAATKILGTAISFCRVCSDFSEYQQKYAPIRGGQWFTLVFSYVLNFACSVVLFMILPTVLDRLNGRMPEKIRYSHVSERGGPTEMSEISQD